LLDADPDDLPASAGEPQLSLGIATVDAERFAADRGWAIATLPGDALVGAFAWGVEGHRSLILLEPDIEARLAATLARHAEGPAVLYLRFTATPLASLRRRLVDAGLIASAATAGPFGPECLVGAGPAWGPHLVVSGS
jgi:hypothetical protein